MNASVFLLETDSFAIFESAIEGEYSWIESSIQDHTGTSGNYYIISGRYMQAMAWRLQ